MTFQKVFILRQHTPIIHFQWKGGDATLRPGELKAKLDRFILQREAGKHWLGADEETAFIKNSPTLFKGRIKRKDNGQPEHPALDYQVAVRAERLATGMLTTTGAIPFGPDTSETKEGRTSGSRRSR